MHHPSPNDDNSKETINNSLIRQCWISVVLRHALHCTACFSRVSIIAFLQPIEWLTVPAILYICISWLILISFVSWLSVICKYWQLSERLRYCNVTMEVWSSSAKWSRIWQNYNYELVVFKDLLMLQHETAIFIQLPDDASFDKFFNLGMLLLSLTKIPCILLMHC